MSDYFDDVEILIRENKWLKQFFEGQGCCTICGHSDPFDLEGHHVGGKSNSPYLISLCRNCHGRVSRKQYSWPKGWSEKNKPKSQKIGCLLIGFSDVLRAIGERAYYES
jgi:uncharacterized protein YlaI